MDYHGYEFTDKTITLDGNGFTECSFTGCVLVYSGGNTHMRGVVLRDTAIRAEGAALRTLGFLQLLDREIGTGAALRFAKL